MRRFSRTPPSCRKQCSRGPGDLPVGVTLLVVGFLCGCTDRDPTTNETSQTASYVLSAEDYGTFVPGGERDEILAALHSKGNFEMSAVIDEQEVTGISFGIVSTPFDGPGQLLWAVFIDGKFSKFVKWPANWTKDPIPVGDFSRLVAAMDAEAVDIRLLDQQVRALPAAPSETDLGLTVVGWVFGSSIKRAREKDIERNRELRDQYNAARLRIGMTVDEVEEILDASPLRVWRHEDAAYPLYGSTDLLSILPYEHYSNILVIIREDRIRGIYSGYSVPGGPNTIQRVQDGFTGLEAHDLVE